MMKDERNWSQQVSHKCRAVFSFVARAAQLDLQLLDATAPKALIFYALHSQLSAQSEILSWPCAL